MMMVSICCLAAVFAGVHADGDGGKPSPPPPAIEFDATLNDYAVPHLPQALRNHQPELTSQHARAACQLGTTSGLAFCSGYIGSRVRRLMLRHRSYR